jgi:hypothetical protein
MERAGQHQQSVNRDVVELIRDLARVASDLEITRILNRLHLRTGKDNTWIEGRVRALRNYHNIPVYSPEEVVRSGWLNMAQTADYLGISPMSVRRLLLEKIIKGKQVIAHAPWIIRREDLETEAVKLAVLAIKSGKRLRYQKIRSKQSLIYQACRKEGYYVANSFVVNLKRYRVCEVEGK